MCCCNRRSCNLPDTTVRANLSEYLRWLRGYVKEGGKPTYYYPYPWSRAGMRLAPSGRRLVIDSDREFGADARKIIVEKDVTVARTNTSAGFGGWGHDTLYMMEGFRTEGSIWVPVYQDPEFGEFAKNGILV